MSNNLLPAISTALTSAGFSGTLPEADAVLADHGVDSLMQALWIVELEGAFKQRFSIADLESDAFRSFAGVDALLRTKGLA